MDDGVDLAILQRAAEDRAYGWVHNHHDVTIWDDPGHPAWTCSCGQQSSVAEANRYTRSRAITASRRHLVAQRRKRYKYEIKHPDEEND